MNNVSNLLKQKISPENILINEPMKNHTSFRIGGPADILVSPQNAEELRFTVEACAQSDVPYIVIGNGTNLLVRDKGIRGVVIKTASYLKDYRVEEGIISAEAGISLAKLAAVALEKELAGLEFASGIPGSLGGAVMMNAGAYGGEMKDVVVETEYITSDGKIEKVTLEQHNFGHRDSIFQHNGGIIVRSSLRLKKGNKNDIKALMEDLNMRRKEKQPLSMPSAGSVFKRPEGFFAGKLIEDCGLKGHRIGGAEVSELHGGFIINRENATAEDVLKLIKFIQDTVREKFGVALQPEIRIIGEE